MLENHLNFPQQTKFSWSMFTLNFQTFPQNMWKIKIKSCLIGSFASDSTTDYHQIIHNDCLIPVSICQLSQTTTPHTPFPYLKCSSCCSSTYIFNLYEKKNIYTSKPSPISTHIQMSTHGSLRRLIPRDSKKKLLKKEFILWNFNKIIKC